jgi:hypothetical protein
MMFGESTGRQCARIQNNIGESERPALRCGYSREMRPKALAAPVKNTGLVARSAMRADNLVIELVNVI